MSESTILNSKTKLQLDSSSDTDEDHRVKPKLNNVNDVSDYVEPPFDKTRLFIDGINDNCTDEMIRLYLLLIVNETLDERFKIEKLRRNNSRVLVKFNREFDFDFVSAKQQKLPELCSEIVRFHRVRVPNAIKISNLPNNCSEEILRLYFTNTKVSDGGDIDRIRLFSFDSKALIAFRNYNVVQRVLSRTHIICENTVRLEKFYAAIEDETFFEEDIDDDTLVVSKSITADNKAKKDVKRDKLKKPNSIEQLKISSSFSSAPLADRTKVIVSNLQENINIQQLDFFIQLLSNKAEVGQVSWSFEFKGKLLIEFKKEVDLKKILQEYHKNAYNNLNGKQVQIEPVNLTRTLIIVIKELGAKDTPLKFSDLSQPQGNAENGDEVSKIPATRDLLELYFVNKQRSGGGEIEFIERRSARYWLIKMKDQRTIKEILSRKHIVDFKEIKVFPYYENFGLPYLIHFNIHNSEENAHSLPYKLKIKDDRLRYFVKVKSLHQKLNDILSESNGISKYNKSESNILYVHYQSKVATNVPYLEKIWRIRVKESIEYFLQIYKYEKLTLSYNQWSTILKTKQINEALLYKQSDDVDDDYDGGRIIDNESESNRNKFFGNLAVISVKDSTTNIEINIVGPTLEVDKFIVKVKDIICKAYFTYELEERIINFKTYLLDCEQLLGKWLQDKEFNSDDDSDVEILLTSSRKDLTDTSSLSASYTSKRRNDEANTGKLDKTKRKTIDEFLTKLERDHMDMELSYGKLFQELGYTFLTRQSNVDENENEEDGDYHEFNDHATNGMDESYLGTTKNEVESEMDRIKHTLDELKGRIADMRKKFRQYLLSMKKAKKLKKVTAKSGRSNANTENEIEEDDDDEDDVDKDLIKLCVFVKEQMKIITLNIHRKCKIRELKQILSKQIDEDEVTSPEDQKLTFNGVELINDTYSISDYGISNKCTVTCEISE